MNQNWNVPFVSQLQIDTKCWVAAMCMLEYWKHGATPSSDQTALTQMRDYLDQRQSYVPGTIQPADVQKVAQTLGMTRTKAPKYASATAAQAAKSRAKAFAPLILSGPVAVFGVYSSVNDDGTTATWEHVTVVKGMNGHASKPSELRTIFLDPWNSARTAVDIYYDTFDSNYCVRQDYWVHY